MRSTILLTSAMAVGAIAGPLNKRWIFTSIDLKVVTETVYVYATAPAPAPAPAPTATAKASDDGNKQHGHSRVHSTNPSSKSKVVPVPTSTVVPVPSSKAVPVPSSKAVPKPTSVYTPPPPPPSSTPASTSVYTPPPAPSSVVTPEPVSSSAAPVPTQEPTSGQHLSGDIQSTLSSGTDYEAAVLYHHNAARANHDAEPLVWDEACRANAETAANKCDFTHYIPEGSGQGQNLFTVSGDSFNVTAGITESWYKGEFKEMTDNNLWGAENIPDSIFHSVGHLTQMLWKATTKVGCVSIDCGSQMTINGDSSSLNKYTVCNYASPGNVGGAYAKNVGLPSSYASLGSWSD